MNLIIRGGRVADGRGGSVYEADVAVRNGRIARVGSVPEKGDVEIDARGLLVTPGFVDSHTHYDFATQLPHAALRVYVMGPDGSGATQRNGHGW